MDRWTRRVVGGVVAPVLVASLYGLFAGGETYTTDFPPPTGRETYVQIMPVSVGDQPMDIEPVLLDEGRYHGVRARYGDGATVEIVQVHALGDVDGYIERHLAPRMERYRHRASGKVDGRWQSRASGPGRLYGWQNGNWLFVIEAADDRLFDEAVDGFAYIRRE